MNRLYASGRWRALLVLPWSLFMVLVVAFLVVTLAPRPVLRYAVHALDADERTLALAAEGGFDTVVQLFSWRQIEPTRGQFHWQYPDEVVRGASYFGLDLVIRLDQHPAWASSSPITINAPPDELADYAAFVHTVARRYRGRVLAYIVWNEPNLAVEWGGQPPDPERYVEMLQLSYQAIKDADPEALVVSAGLAPTNSHDAQALDDRVYLDAMYRASAQKYFDVLGAHPYGFAYPPTDPRGAHGGLNLARIQDLRQIMVENGDEGKPIWATELGWTVQGDGPTDWQEVSQEEQAEYLVYAYRRAYREWSWLQLVAVWNLGGEDHPEWRGFSLLDAEGQPRPAFTALRQMPKPPYLRGWVRQLRMLATQLSRSRFGRRYPTLADDAVIHLGDSDFSEPWIPLFGARNPSTEWTGIVYLDDPGQRQWQLTMRIMQSNVWGSFVWINGQRLEPPFPQEDFSGSWVSHTWKVPAHLLQAGPNRVQISIERTLPVLQDRHYAWDDLQFKDIVLWR